MELIHFIFFKKNNPFYNFQIIEEINEKIQIYLYKIKNQIKLNKEEE